MPVRTDEGYEKLSIPTFTKTRDTSDQIHAYLRHLIIDEVLPAGSELNQAELARRMGVSRIPMREAFRMLQQEGLIDVQLNQRAVIRELDAHEVDDLYGTRIALESLGVRITSGHLTEAEDASASTLLQLMRDSVASGDMAAWVAAHRRFHSVCTIRAGEPLARLILSYSERTERYLRFAQLAHPGAFGSAELEHQAILDALRSGDAARGGALMAEHLSHTARIVLADLGSTDEAGSTITEALAMSTGAETGTRPGVGPGRASFDGRPID
ncbi:GntR family transcriptional regulator [Herbiconiux sp. VKM Ac-1786]|uniref:GntR family transcriptional regulator n=1 Tax=Herbiconiux sp. VKM Ac-1786 TaxID=2783824 RepID=UPI00188D257B|nr:GntR family transcriptional regulator [Herbiconiux sp. VKM Ac-1786]MBF4571851.1 GntR family transcriptional regulator [Herbiconiux sp. VKM Ac-1786]